MSNLNNTDTQSINITPQSVVHYLSKVEIVSIQIDLYKSATFRVILKSEDSTYAVSKEVLMPTADYALWGNDDQYAENYILQKLGLIRT